MALVNLTDVSGVSYRISGDDEYNKELLNAVATATSDIINSYQNPYITVKELMDSGQIRLDPKMMEIINYTKSHDLNEIATKYIKNPTTAEQILQAVEVASEYPVENSIGSEQETRVEEVGDQDGGGIKLDELLADKVTGHIFLNSAGVARANQKKLNVIFIFNLVEHRAKINAALKTKSDEEDNILNQIVQLIKDQKDEGIINSVPSKFTDLETALLDDITDLYKDISLNILLSGSFYIYHMFDNNKTVLGPFQGTILFDLTNDAIISFESNEINTDTLAYFVKMDYEYKMSNNYESEILKILNGLRSNDPYGYDNSNGISRIEALLTDPAQIDDERSNAGDLQQTIKYLDPNFNGNLVWNVSYQANDTNVFADRDFMAKPPNYEVTGDNEYGVDKIIQDTDWFENNQDKVFIISNLSDAIKTDLDSHKLTIRASIVNDAENGQQSVMAELLNLNNTFAQKIALLEDQIKNNAAKYEHNKGTKCLLMATVLIIVVSMAIYYLGIPALSAVFAGIWSYFGWTGAAASGLGGIGLAGASWANPALMNGIYGTIGGVIVSAITSVVPKIGGAAMLLAEKMLPNMLVRRLAGVKHDDSSLTEAIDSLHKIILPKDRRDLFSQIDDDQDVNKLVQAINNVKKGGRKTKRKIVKGKTKRKNVKRSKHFKKSKNKTIKQRGGAYTDELYVASNIIKAIYSIYDIFLFPENHDVLTVSDLYDEIYNITGQIRIPAIYLNIAQ